MQCVRSTATSFPCNNNKGRSPMTSMARAMDWPENRLLLATIEKQFGLISEWLERRWNVVFVGEVWWGAFIRVRCNTAALSTFHWRHRTAKIGHTSEGDWTAVSIFRLASTVAEALAEKKGDASRRFRIRDTDPSSQNELFSLSLLWQTRRGKKKLFNLSKFKLDAFASLHSRFILVFCVRNLAQRWRQ